MRTVLAAFLLLGLGLIEQSSCVAQDNTSSQRTTDNQRRSQEVPPRRVGTQFRTNHAKTLPNARPVSGNAPSIHHPAANRPGGSSGERAGLQNGRVNHASSARPSNTSRLAGTSLNTDKHVGHNSAVVGALKTAEARNPGQINGASIKRKP